MAYTSDDQKKIFLKILYAGPAGSGKTTNLQSLYKQTAKGLKSRRFDLHDLTLSSPFFDFLPLSYPLLSHPQIDLHLYTLPSHDLWPYVLNTLITGVDGCVFVLNSRAEQIYDNEKSWDRLKRLFFQNGVKDLNEIPMVCQCNHRDADSALPLQSLKTAYSDWPILHWIEGVSVQDIGVFETLQKLVLRVLDRALPDSDMRHILSQSRERFEGSEHSF